MKETIPSADAPLEDRIEAARALGVKTAKNGGLNINSFLPHQPEYKAWQDGYDAHKPPPFDSVKHAREMGVRDASFGAGFVNSYPIGTPERRAWQEGYDSTPKGTAKSSGPQGRSEAEFMASIVQQVATAAEVTITEPLNAAAAEVMPSIRKNLPTYKEVFPTDTTVDLEKYRQVYGKYPPGSVGKYEGPASGELPKTLAGAEFWNEKPGAIIPRPIVADPYTNMLAEAKRQGAAAYEAEQPIGSNPYNAPESRLEGPSEAWAAGWNEARAEGIARAAEAARKDAEAKTWELGDKIADRLTPSPLQFSGELVTHPHAGELIRTEPVTRESVAAAVLPAMLVWMWRMSVNGTKPEMGRYADIIDAATNIAVEAADDLLKKLAKK